MADPVRNVALQEYRRTARGRAPVLPAHPRVLLLQSAGDDRDMYALYLRYHRVPTLVAASALEAMAIVPSADVIVTGIGLAGVADGLEFVRAARRAVARHIPVIVLTAYAHQSDRERAFAAGCDRFLSKPCLPPALLDEIYDVWDEAPSKRYRENGMTVELLLALLRSHLAALQSNAWPHSHPPALFLDAAETSALIAELSDLQSRAGEAAGG